MYNHITGYNDDVPEMHAPAGQTVPASVHIVKFIPYSQCGTHQKRSSEYNLAWSRMQRASKTRWGCEMWARLKCGFLTVRSTQFSSGETSMCISMPVNHRYAALRRFCIALFCSAAAG